MHQGEWLKAEIGRKKLSVAEFARRVGVARQQVHFWFKQEHLPFRLDMMWASFDVLGLANEARRRGIDRGAAQPSQAVEAFIASNHVDAVQIASAHARGNAPGEFSSGPLPLAEIPTFDLSLSAGPWADVLDVPDVCNADSIRQGFFRVRLAGNSMSPKWKSGMIVEFECLRPGARIIVGRDYYVQRDDGAATFKRVESLTDDGIVLRAINRARYPNPIPIERRRITNMALAVAEHRPVE